MTTWFITGISRGLGKSLASAALAAGDTVVGTVRTEPFSIDHDKGELHVIPVDLVDGDAAEAAVTHAFDLVGRIDVIVNMRDMDFLEHWKAPPIRKLRDCSPSTSLPLSGLSGRHCPIFVAKARDTSSTSRRLPGARQRRGRRSTARPNLPLKACRRQWRLKSGRSGSR